MDAKRLGEMADALEKIICRPHVSFEEFAELDDAVEFLREEAAKRNPYAEATAKELVLWCRVRGVGISVNSDGFIWYHEPLMSIDPELWQEVQRRKAEVVAYLQAEKAEKEAKAKGPTFKWEGGTDKAPALTLHCDRLLPCPRDGILCRTDDPAFNAVLAVEGVGGIYPEKYKYSITKGFLFSWDKIKPAVEAILCDHFAEQDKPKAKEEKTNFWDCTVGIVVHPAKPDPKPWQAYLGEPSKKPSDQTPMVRGTPYSVCQVVQGLATGRTVAEIIKNKPCLTEEMVKACAEWGIEKLKEVAA